MVHNVRGASNPLKRKRMFTMNTTVTTGFLTTHANGPAFGGRAVCTCVSSNNVRRRVSRNTNHVTKRLNLSGLVVFCSSGSVRLSARAGSIVSRSATVGCHT